MPTFVDRVARQALYAAGFRSVEVPTSVGTIHLLARGGGGALPPVLFVHGLGASSANWSYLLRALRPHVRGLLAVDLPAHGFSAVPAGGLTSDALERGVLEALDAAQAEPMVVLGNSLGGAAAIRYTLARPDRVRGLCLLSPAGAPLDEADLAALRGHFQVDTLRDAVAFVDRLVARPRPLARLLAPELRRRLSDPNLRQWIASVTPDDFLAPEDLARLQVPLHLVWGQQERILPERALAFFQRHLPEHAEIARPDGYGHSPHIDDPRGVLRRVLAFLEQVASGDGSTDSTPRARAHPDTSTSPPRPVEGSDA